MKKICILLLILFILSGCNVSDKKNEESGDDLIKIEPICQNQINSLESICKNENNDLNIESLAKCDWIIEDKLDFLQHCEDFDYYYSSGESAFSKKIVEICDNTMFGNLTAKEITICMEVSDNFYFLR